MDLCLCVATVAVLVLGIVHPVAGVVGLVAILAFVAGRAATDMAAARSAVQRPTEHGDQDRKKKKKKKKSDRRRRHASAADQTVAAPEPEPLSLQQVIEQTDPSGMTPDHVRAVKRRIRDEGLQSQVVGRGLARNLEARTRIMNDNLVEPLEARRKYIEFAAHDLTHSRDPTMRLRRRK